MGIPTHSRRMRCRSLTIFVSLPFQSAPFLRCPAMLVSRVYRCRREACVASLANGCTVGIGCIARPGDEHLSTKKHEVAMRRRLPTCHVVTQREESYAVDLAPALGNGCGSPQPYTQ